MIAVVASAAFVMHVRRARAETRWERAPVQRVLVRADGTASLKRAGISQARVVSTTALREAIRGGDQRVVRVVCEDKAHWNKMESVLRACRSEGKRVALVVRSFDGSELTCGRLMFTGVWRGKKNKAERVSEEDESPSWVRIGVTVANRDDGSPECSVVGEPVEPLFGLGPALRDWFAENERDELHVTLAPDPLASMRNVLLAIKELEVNDIENVRVYLDYVFD